MSVYTALLAELFTAISAMLPGVETSHPEIVPSREQKRNSAGLPSFNMKLPAGVPVVATVPVGEPVPMPDAAGMVTLNATLPDASFT